MTRKNKVSLETLITNDIKNLSDYFGKENTTVIGNTSIPLCISDLMIEVSVTESYPFHKLHALPGMLNNSEHKVHGIKWFWVFTNNPKRMIFKITKRGYNQVK